METQAPIGSICVIRDEQLLGWLVAVCHGTHYSREILARFASQGEALEFARLEQGRRNQGGAAPYVLNADDCPCRLRRKL